jgi:hypothetical protein
MLALLKSQRVAQVLIALGASIGTTAVVLYFFQSSIITFLLGMLAAFIISRVLGSIASAYYMEKYYGNDLQSYIKDANDAAIYFANKFGGSAYDVPVQSDNEAMFEIVALPEKPSAVWMGVPINDWMDMECEDGVVRRFNFHGTVNGEEGSSVAIPDDCILIPPGLLYQVDVTINTPA